MRILALDTSGPIAGAALMEDGAIRHEIILNHGLTHSQTAMTIVDQVMCASGLSPTDIDVYAAVAGPGSFTGVRIGVCAVRGLAHAAGKRALAVDALEALAVNAFGFHGVICPILDARRTQVYCAAFRFERGERPLRLMKDDALKLDDFLGRLPSDEPLLFLGDGLTLFPQIQSALGSRAVAAPAPMAYIRPSAACMIAQYCAGEAGDCFALKPIYLRAPQAEREREARLSAQKREEG